MEAIRLGIVDTDPVYAKSVSAVAEFYGHTVVTVAENNDQLRSAMEMAHRQKEPIDMFLYGTDVIDCGTREGILAQRRYDKASKSLRSLGFFVVRYEKGPRVADWAYDSPHRNIFKVLADIHQHPEVRPRKLNK